MVNKKDQEVNLLWITCRDHLMTIPGGVQVEGMIHWREPVDEEKGDGTPDNIPYVGEYYNWYAAEAARKGTRNPFKSALDIFALHLCWAEGNREAREKEVNATFESLDFLEPVVLGLAEKTAYALSFREYEAAKAAFDRGYRAIKHGGQWSWPELGKLQEKEESKSSA